MDKLTELSKLCKGEVSVFINEHRCSHISVKEYLDDEGIENNIDGDLVEEMIRRDTIVCVFFHPDTPVGYHTVYHYDVESALNMALEIVHRERYDDEVVDEAVWIALRHTYPHFIAKEIISVQPMDIGPLIIKDINENE